MTYEEAQRILNKSWGAWEVGRASYDQACIVIQNHELQVLEYKRNIANQHNQEHAKNMQAGV